MEYNASVPAEITLEPIGNDPYDDKQYNKFRVKANHPIPSVPADGYVGSLSKESPVIDLREKLALVVDVPTICISIAYEGRELIDEKTMKENSVVEPGPAARKRGARIELQFALKEGTLPGAVIKANAAKKDEAAAAEAARLAEEKRLRLEEEGRKAAAEMAKRQALEAEERTQREGKEYELLLKRQPMSMQDRVRFQCAELGDGSENTRGIVVEMPKDGLVGQFARHLYNLLDIGVEPGVVLVFGPSGRLTGKEKLDEVGIGHNSTVPFHAAREPGEAVQPAAAKESVFREPVCYAFQNAKEMEVARASACAKQFIEDFKRTGGWPYTPPEAEQREVEQLTLCQLEGITAVRNKCRNDHHEAVMAMTERAESLCFSELNFVVALEWVRELAPIIIHVDLGEFGDKLAHDTHYRNQFETNASRGGLNHQKMIDVENELFVHAYDKGKGAERVKYGVLNFANNPRGITSCSGYGEDYLVLKGVRLRTTLCSDDTWRETALGTPDYYAHIFAKYKDNEFCAAMKLARDKKVAKGCEDITNGQYKEVQIHGEVRLREHIAKIVVHERHRGKIKFQDTLSALQKNVWRLRSFMDGQRRGYAASIGCATISS